jgi:hypothetical protein
MLQKLLAFTKKVADLPDRPSLNSAELKAQFDAAPEELRQTFNKLVDDLTTIPTWMDATLENGFLMSSRTTPTTRKTSTSQTR